MNEAECFAVRTIMMIFSKKNKIKCYMKFGFRYVERPEVSSVIKS